MIETVAADAICRAIATYQSFTISTHINPDGDAIGSQLALCSFLNELGKQVWMVNRDPVPTSLTFLPAADQITNIPPAERTDVLVVLDAGDLQRIGEELVDVLTPRHCLLNIDHHAHASSFGHHNLIVPQACATSEILYYFFHKYGTRLGIPTGQEIGRERAEYLYTGIMYDTGCFRYSNATPQAHKVAAELIAEGLAVDTIYEHVYENVPERKIRLLARILGTLRIVADGRFAHVHVTRRALEEEYATEEDLDGFINYVRMIDSVEVAAMFSQTLQGGTKVSLRSTGGVDVGALSNALGGGGHVRAAGCTLTESLDDAMNLITEQVEASLRNDVVY